MALLAIMAGCGGGSSPSGPTPTTTPAPSPTPRALWTASGSGDNVLDMPTTVARVKVTGDYPGRSSNFIIYVGGRLLVNELIGTAWPNGPHFEGTYTTGGGVTEIRNSSGVAWTFTEVR